MGITTFMGSAVSRQNFIFALIVIGFWDYKDKVLIRNRQRPFWVGEVLCLDLCFSDIL